MRWLVAVLVAAAIGVPIAYARPALRTVRADDVSLGVPAGWRSVTRHGQAQLVAAAPRREDGVYTNANVVVIAGANGPVKIADLIAGIRSQGIEIGGLATTSVRLPAGRALRVRYGGFYRGYHLSCLAYVVQTRGKAYVLTFASSRSAYARHAAVFVSMARSLRLR
jgi:hypothetical protein